MENLSSHFFFLVIGVVIGVFIARSLFQTFYQNSRGETGMIGSIGRPVGPYGGYYQQQQQQSGPVPIGGMLALIIFFGILFLIISKKYEQGRSAPERDIPQALYEEWEDGEQLLPADHVLYQEEGALREFQLGP